MMKLILVFALALGLLVVHEQPAEAGLFRRGPMMRFLFGGPIRRRMIARRMFRRGVCPGCMARRIPPRCGFGPQHGGGCGFRNPNFRDFRNQRNFQFFGDPLRSQFDPGLNPALNPFFNPNASQFFPFNSNNSFFNPRGGFSSVSAQRQESELERLYEAAKEPEFSEVKARKWAGFCEDALGARTVFELPEIKDQKFREGSLILETQGQSYFMRSIDENRLAVKRESSFGRGFCLLEEQKSN